MILIVVKTWLGRESGAETAGGDLERAEVLDLVSLQGELKTAFRTPFEIGPLEHQTAPSAGGAGVPDLELERFTRG